VGHDAVGPGAELGFECLAVQAPKDRKERGRTRRVVAKLNF
jgi:hypothetical protein